MRTLAESSVSETISHFAALALSVIHLMNGLDDTDWMPSSSSCFVPEAVCTRTTGLPSASVPLVKRK